LGRGDQESQASVGGQEGGGYWEDVGESLYGSEGYHVEGVRGQGFGADVLYIDVRQCNGAGCFGEEGGFLLAGFDQREGDVGSPEFYGDTGEAGAGTEVGYSGFGLQALGFGLRALGFGLRALGIGDVRIEVNVFQHRGHGGHGVNLGE